MKIQVWILLLSFDSNSPYFGPFLFALFHFSFVHINKTMKIIFVHNDKTMEIAVKKLQTNGLPASSNFTSNIWISSVGSSNVELNKIRKSTFLYPNFIIVYHYTFVAYQYTDLPSKRPANRISQMLIGQLNLLCFHVTNLITFINIIWQKFIMKEYWNEIRRTTLLYLICLIL